MTPDPVKTTHVIISFDGKNLTAGYEPSMIRGKVTHEKDIVEGIHSLVGAISTAWIVRDCTSMTLKFDKSVPPGYVKPIKDMTSRYAPQDL